MSRKANEEINLQSLPSGQESGDDYNPHLYREVPNPTNNTETLIHLLKGCLGTGILAMPEAFKYAGIWNGIASTLFIGFVCTYCLHILVDSQYILCKRLRVPIITYPNSMKLALESGPNWLKPTAKYSPVIVNFFLATYHLGICCVYILFVGVNIKAVVDQYHTLSIYVYLGASFVPFLLIYSIRNLKLLAPFSTLANIFTFICFGAVCYYVFQDLPDIHQYPAVSTFMNYALFFGTTLFALEAVGVVIALENNMKTPQHFGRVLNIAMIIVTLLYAGMGFMGYWRYGDDIEASISLNFPSGDILTMVMRILYSLAIYISYALQGYVPIFIIWNTYILPALEGRSKLLFWEFVVRFFCVLITFVLAMTIPMLGLFISLFGSFCLSTLGIAFPAIMEICVKWPNRLGRCQWILIKDLLLVIFGFCGLLAGTYSVVAEMVQRFQTGQY